jgi:hypothetical protein
MGGCAESRRDVPPTPTARLVGVYLVWCMTMQSPALRGSVIWPPRWQVLNHNRLTIFQIADGHFDIRISRFQILRGLDRDRFDVAV